MTFRTVCVTVGAVAASLCGDKNSRGAIAYLALAGELVRRTDKEQAQAVS